MPKNENICPKCGKRMSPFYLKQNCPDCGVDLLYYKLNERLEADAKEAAKQSEAVGKFFDTVKSSSIASPLLIVRLVLFFTPLASMCLAMYGDVSLISAIVGMIKGETAIGDVIMPLLSMGLVVVLSLAVIISSLFSSTKSGLIRNIIFSAINIVVFVAVGLVTGGMQIGWYITLGILIVEILLHFLCDNIIRKD